MHNAFATRAKSYTEEFKTLERYTFYCVIGIIADILLFGGIQIVNVVFLGKSFNYYLIIYQSSIAIALIYAVWMYNRNQKIAKKLAEEYHHKAALSEAMTGYRYLYNLSHEDEEYLELFNSIKEQLNINPSKKIDKFLTLKTPQEEFTSGVLKTLDPENLEKLAKELKPILEKIKI